MKMIRRTNTEAKSRSWSRGIIEFQTKFWSNSLSWSWSKNWAWAQSWLRSDSWFRDEPMSKSGTWSRFWTKN